MEIMTITIRSEWREWLEINHNRSTGVWMVFYKKHCDVPTLNYEDFVEEALCFGWIDSIIKKLDEDRYIRKATPRRFNSVWSELNKKRVFRLEKAGLMTDAGRKLIVAAKKSGTWNTIDKPEIHAEMDPEFQNALDVNQKAKSCFHQLSPSHQKRYLFWIQMAKQPGTRNRRIREAVTLLINDQKLGLK